MRPTRVEEDEPVSTDQVDTTSTGLATQQEDKLLAVRVIELVNQLLPLVDRLRAVQAEVPVPAKCQEYQIRTRNISVPLAPEHLLEDIQCLRVVADKHDLVGGFRSDTVKESSCMCE